MLTIQRVMNLKKRTEIDIVSLKLLGPLGLVELEHGAVPGVAAMVDVVLDLRSPFEPSDSAVGGLAPRGFQKPEEVVQDANVLLQVLQLGLLEPLGPRAGEGILLELLSHALHLANLLRDKSTRLLL